MSIHMIQKSKIITSAVLFGLVFGVVAVAGAATTSGAGTTTTTTTTTTTGCSGTGTGGAGWTAPSSAPTAGNVAAPINVGSTDQAKDGKVTLRGVVESKEEHDQVLKLAQAFAASDNITDNIEVKHN